MVAEMFRQFSLFDIEPVDYPVAVNLFDQEEYRTLPLEDWMRRLVPDGEFLIMVWKYPCILRRTELAAGDVATKGMAYCHWVIGGALYSGTFIGTGLDDAESEADG